MGSLKKYTDKLYLKQWGLGYLKASLADIIREKKSKLSFEWLPLNDTSTSWADPFIFRGPDKKVNILFESVSTVKLDGNISLLTCDDDMNIESEKVILDNGQHLSYPFTYQENGKIYVIPENAFSGGLYAYELDYPSGRLHNKTEMLPFKVIDPTILKADNRYWMFCTMLGDTLNSDLHIFYADSLLGPYTAHSGNPVRSDLIGSRPAGNFIVVDGGIYRPAQNCVNYYGESITINKVNLLTTTRFEEEVYMTIEPNEADEFNYGIHTINAIDDLIIVDGQKVHFQPVRQLGRKIRKIFN
jgi:hypothetical protein